MTLYGDSPHPYSGRRLAAATAGTLLSVAVAFLAIWQISLHNGRGALAPAHGRTPAVVQRNNPIPRATAAPSANAVPAVSGAAPVSGPLGPRLVIVDSDERAKAVTDAIEQAELLRSQLGLPPADVRVVVENSDADFKAAVAAVADENNTRTLLGLPEIQVEDLRNQLPAEAH